jgi:hypothetical protein
VLDKETFVLTSMLYPKILGSLFNLLKWICKTRERRKQRNFGLETVADQMGVLMPFRTKSKPKI